MKKIFLILFLPNALFAQLKGTVLSESDRQPIPFASVFINNSTIGSITDEKGHFNLQGLTAGKYELVVSLLGYEKYFSVITIPQGAPLTILLREKITQLDQVTIHGFEKDGWKTWGTLFMETFIGTSANAHQTVLKNTKDLRFHLNKKDNLLEVFALAPLKIQNKALGYDLEYHLELFRIDFSNNTQVYAGYPFFKEHKTVSKRNLKNRETTYHASLTKFIQSLYHNTLQQEGYIVRKMENVRNKEKDRVRSLRNKYSLYQTDESGKRIYVSEPAYPPEIYTKDSLTYFKKILSQPDSQFLLYNDTLSASQLIHTDTSGLKKLSFSDYLFVVNTRHLEEPLYLDFKREKRAVAPQSSFLKMVESEEIEIQENGNIFPPLNLLAGDYWGWFNKIADLLPLGYKPSSPKP